MKQKQGGFTLIELLIAITLMAVIVAVLSISVRNGLQAWTRGKEANRKILGKEAIENLLARQLRAHVRKIDDEIAGFSVFEAQEDKLVFSTTYVPMGAQAGGIFLVVYQYDRDQNQVIYAQKLLTRIEDLKDEVPDKWDDEPDELLEKGWLVSRLQTSQALSFRYKNVQEDWGETDDWERDWLRKPELPSYVGVCWVDSAEQADQGECHTLSVDPLTE